MIWVGTIAAYLILLMALMWGCNKIDKVGN